MRYANLSKEEREEKIEAYLENRERRALKSAIQSELNEQFQTLREYVSEQYKLNEHEGEITQIKDKLQNEFSGEAQKALDQRLGQHFEKIWITNKSFPPLMNSLSANKGWFS